MLPIVPNYLRKVSPKSLRGLAKELDIPPSTFSNALFGAPMRDEYQAKMRQKLERMRIGPALNDVSLLLPDQASLYYRYAACDEEARWALFDTPQPPIFKRGKWWYQHDSDRLPLMIAGIFAPVPGDTDPASQALYQRDLETRLWYKISFPYNARLYSDEEVQLAIKNPRILSHYERGEKMKLYRPAEEAPQDDF